MRNFLSLFLLLFLSLASIAFAKEVILDVRTPKEFRQEHVPHSLNIDVLNPSFKTEVAKLSRQDNYRVYCGTGKRSAQAIAIMKDLGFKKTENLGGLEDAKKVLLNPTLIK